MKILRLAARCVPVLLAASAWAQSFTSVERAPEAVEALPPFVRPADGSVFRIDWARLEDELRAAAAVPGGERAPADQQVVLMLPTPEGGLARYRVVESSILAPELAARFPSLRTYRVRGVDDPIAVGRLDITSHGFRGMIRTSAGTTFIDPYAATEREHVSVYDLGRFVGGSDWACHVGAEHGAGPIAPGAEEPLEGVAGASDGLPLRVYRMAMACSGEYGAYQAEVQERAPNIDDALSAIVTVVNRCNVVFEADAGVRFVMIAQSDQLAFFDPATDPYPDADPMCTADPAANCSGGYLGANITALNTIIGSPNFDIGHVLTRVRGGVAYLRSACTANKAGGVSGIPRGGEIEPVSALVPLHELGHQYGANHTFNGVLGRCNANINGTTNWEPGGGSSLMAYPGACPVGGTIGEGDTDNLVLFADPHFHTGSVMEIRSFLNGQTSRCSTTEDVGNIAEPQITALTPSGLSVPPLTPFELTTAASDDGMGLSYQWDQLDVGAAQRLTGPTSEDNGASALFRTNLPSASATRTLPRLSDLLTGTAYIGERMPTLAGAVRKFRVTVRDGQGATAVSSRVDVNIAAGSPFVVTAPGAGAAVAGPMFNVAWSAAAIAGAPFNGPSVRITLSLDGGLTFPIVLAEAAPNTGMAMVNAGAAASPSARVKVAPTGQIFFNISGPFALLPACPADFNADGSVDPDDLGDFINCYFGSPQPPMLPCPGADFNADGSVNPDDLGDFVNAYFGGCGG
ncbi:MAG: reprolysin-like metallopeptidase [Phycisphaerales bacterium]